MGGCCRKNKNTVLHYALNLDHQMFLNILYIVALAIVEGQICHFFCVIGTAVPFSAAVVGLDIPRSTIMLFLYLP